MKFREASFRGRKLLSRFAASRGAGPESVAVEIGVHRGQFARLIMEHWPGRYMGVDPWNAHLDGYDNDVLALGKERVPCHGRDRSPDYSAALEILEPYRGRCDFLLMTSEEAAKVLPDDLDFVYIDANHNYEYVLKDIQLWLPKVRPGGVLSGHDVGPCRWSKDVTRAISESLGDRIVHQVRERGSPWSWYTVI